MVTGSGNVLRIATSSGMSVQSDHWILLYKPGIGRDFRTLWMRHPEREEVLLDTHSSLMRRTIYRL